MELVSLKSRQFLTVIFCTVISTGTGIDKVKGKVFPVLNQVPRYEDV